MLKLEPNTKNRKKEQIKKGEENPKNKVLWYSIEGLDHIPCDKDKPYGQTYQGLVFHSYVEPGKEEDNGNN